MKLLVVSHKETWADPSSASGYVTIGGFPFQMAALSELFEFTQLLVFKRLTKIPDGAIPLTGNHLSVQTLIEPKGINLKRKINIILWLPRNISSVWKLVKEAEVVHAPIPGDLGVIGLLIALIQRKFVFVRHCGRWGIPSSRFDSVLQWFLEKIASEKIVVFATGASEERPSRKNPHIKWIFSSSLREEQLHNMPLAQPWQIDQELKLVTVGSLHPGKNISAIIRSLPLIKDTCPDLKLSIIGTGRLLETLKQEASSLGVASSVEFLGNLAHQQVISILSKSHIFVFPTFYEGFPKALLEAMAVGLPVIANPVSVIPYLLKDNAGLLLQEPTPEAIAASILKLISNSKLMGYFGQQARQKVKDYSLEKWRDQIKLDLESAWGMELDKNQV